jgi:hypothetical protein
VKSANLARSLSITSASCLKSTSDWSVREKLAGRLKRFIDLPELSKRTPRRYNATA